LIFVLLFACVNNHTQHFLDAQAHRRPFMDELLVDNHDIKGFKSDKDES
jgi:hypothetical protein